MNKYATEKNTELVKAIKAAFPEAKPGDVTHELTDGEDTFSTVKLWTSRPDTMSIVNLCRNARAMHKHAVFYTVDLPNKALLAKIQGDFHVKVFDRTDIYNKLIEMGEYELAGAVESGARN